MRVRGVAARAASWRWRGGKRGLVGAKLARPNDAPPFQRPQAQGRWQRPCSAVVGVGLRAPPAASNGLRASAPPQVWMEWSCLDQDAQILPQIATMEQLIYACDVLLTPIVDRPDHATAGSRVASVGYTRLAGRHGHLWLMDLTNTRCREREPHLSSTSGLGLPSGGLGRRIQAVRRARMGGRGRLRFTRVDTRRVAAGCCAARTTRPRALLGGQPDRPLASGWHSAAPALRLQGARRRV